ncbi:plasmid replication protein, CyRepA1 family [Nostoc cycadae]|uniref:Bifunctional DNA primase/polymerase n=1 Tax=Nostoc cycadae WK-1 TaxID=1861711 RepID=A0A2H6LQZ2_9NOSO|nr:plasmid replication protein, CyRepA1 family [Nostoc cycadae]GBE95645.1 bifunctional DNA primase/polymerase [Nostoc cycadae WK-1]
MSRFIATSRNNPCLSCGDISGNCRHQAEGEIILCMSANSGRKGELVDGGYKIIDFSQDGLWAILKPDNTQEWAEEQRREWAEEQRREWAEEQRRRRERLQWEKQQKLTQLPPISERDEQYPRIVAKLGLNQKHRLSELSERRGLNADEIDLAIAQGWLCSWKPGVKVEASPQLAGVANGQLTGVVGLGIAAVSHSGEITGFQIASDNRAKFGKYIWLSSASKGGNSPHLPNGELPVFVWKHPEAEEITESWLVEGSLKSLITALKLWFRYGRKDIQIIGAAGGNWYGSINTVLEALGTINKVFLCPDAGSLVNSHILGNYRKIIDELTSKDYSVNVGWWGQFQKGKHSDIDELPNTLDFQLITPKEFFNHTNKANWLHRRTYTADIVVNQADFKFPKVPKTNAVIGVNSGLGTGKTEALIKLINSSCNRAFLIGYRNNLLLQTGNRASQHGVTIYHLKEDDGISLVPDDSTNLALCLDSIHHIDGYFNDVDIYLDETVSILLHATSGGTLGDEQGKAIAILSKALKECNRVILLDGNLADIHVDFIAKVSGKEVVKIKNEAKIKPHTFKFVVGVDEECELKKRDKSPLIKAMLADGVIPWIASDSRNLTNIIDEIFKSAGKRGYVLNKDTAGEPWAKEFLVSPDEFIANHKPDYFVISPTAESGVSVTIKNYFTDKFTFFTGVQGTNSQHQMLFRLRDDSITHYVFCPEFSQVRDRNNPGNYSAKAFSEAQNSRIMQSAMLAAGGNTNQIMKVIGDAVARSNDDWWALSAELGSIDNYEMDNLRDCLIYALSDVGHSVEVVEWEIDQEFKDKEKSAKEVVQSRYALELFKAIEFENVELANAAAKANPNKDTQRRIEKTRLLDRLPDIENSSVWSHEFINKYYVKDREFISKQQRFYMLNHSDISKKRSEVNWFYMATNQHFFLAQAKGDSHLKVWALQQLNIMQFLEGEYHKESPEVLEVMNKVRTDKEIARALNLKKIPKETTDKRENIAFVSQLLDSIGVKFSKPTQVLINGVKTRLYTVDQEKLNLPSRLEVLKAIARKFDGYLTSDTVAKVKWEEHITTSSPQPQPQPQPQPEIQSEPQSQITASQAEPIDQWLAEENITYIAECLELCESPSDLNDLRLVTPAAALKLAARRLPEAKREIIKLWVIAA